LLHSFLLLVLAVDDRNERGFRNINLNTKPLVPKRYKGKVDLEKQSGLPRFPRRCVGRLIPC